MHETGEYRKDGLEEAENTGLVGDLATDLHETRTYLSPGEWWRPVGDARSIRDGLIMFYNLSDIDLQCSAPFFPRYVLGHER